MLFTIYFSNAGVRMGDRHIYLVMHKRSNATPIIWFEIESEESLEDHPPVFLIEQTGIIPGFQGCI
jgi:hypothetical protein